MYKFVLKCWSCLDNTCETRYEWCTSQQCGVCICCELSYPSYLQADRIIPRPCIFDCECV